MNIERLEYTRNKLLELEERKALFDLGVWADTHRETVVGGKTECGFAGCIVGWAAHEQWWKQFGMEIRLFANPLGSANILEPAVGVMNGNPAAGTLGSRREHLFRDLAVFFDVTVDTIKRIILPEWYDSMPSAGHCALRIERLIKEGEDNFLDSWRDEDGI